MIPRTRYSFKSGITLSFARVAAGSPASAKNCPTRVQPIPTHRFAPHRMSPPKVRRLQRPETGRDGIPAASLACAPTLETRPLREPAPLSTHPRQASLPTPGAMRYAEPMRWTDCVSTTRYTFRPQQTSVMPWLATEPVEGVVCGEMEEIDYVHKNKICAAFPDGCWACSLASGGIRT